MLSWNLIARAYLFLSMLEAAAAMAVFFVVLNSAGWVYGEPLARSDPLYLHATTACLTMIVMMQVVNVLCRHPLKSSLSFGLFSKPLIWPGIGAELLKMLFNIYTPTGNWLFGTAPVGAYVWLLILAGAVLMGGLEEMRKAWLRSTHA